MKDFILSITDDDALPSTFTIRGRTHESVIEGIIDLLEEGRRSGGQRGVTCTCPAFRQSLLDQAIECDRIKETLLDMVDECDECNPGLTDDELRGASEGEVALEDVADESEDDDDGSVSFLFTRFFNNKKGNKGRK